MPLDLSGTTPLGDLFRDERVRRGLTVAEITAATGIAGHHIRAIESEQFDAIPSGVYRRSFVRQYARILGMDEHEIVTAYQQRHPEPPVSLPQLPPRKRRSPPPGLVWLTASGAAIFTFYRFLQPELNARKQGVAEKAALVARSGEQYRAQPPAQATLAPTLTTASAGSADRAALQVAFSAIEPIWVRVKSDGFEVFTGTLSQSKVEQFEAMREVTALVGNAGGLTYLINGKREGPTGLHGEVQSIRFTVEGLRVLTRNTAQ